MITCKPAYYNGLKEVDEINSSANTHGGRAMYHIQRCISILLLITICAPASAQVYRRVGPDGTVYFSDRPAPGAIPVEVQPPQSINLAPLSDSAEATQDTTDKSQQAFPGYTELTVVSPQADEGVRANDGNVMVRLSLEPGLQPSHRFQLTVSGEDGESVMTSDQPLLQLRNLSRGRHTIKAIVLDDKGNSLIEATPVSFNVLRFAGG